VPSLAAGDDDDDDALGALAPGVVLGAAAFGALDVRWGRSLVPRLTSVTLRRQPLERPMRLYR